MLLKASCPHCKSKKLLIRFIPERPYAMLEMIDGIPTFSYISGIGMLYDKEERQRDLRCYAKYIEKIECQNCKFCLRNGDEGPKPSLDVDYCGEDRGAEYLLGSLDFFKEDDISKKKKKCIILEEELREVELLMCDLEFEKINKNERQGEFHCDLKYKVDTDHQFSGGYNKINNFRLVTEKIETLSTYQSKIIINDIRMAYDGKAWCKFFIKLEDDQLFFPHK